MLGCAFKKKWTYKKECVIHIWLYNGYNEMSLWNEHRKEAKLGTPLCDVVFAQSIVECTCGDEVFGV